MLAEDVFTLFPVLECIAHNFVWALVLLRKSVQSVQRYFLKHPYVRRDVCVKWKNLRGEFRVVRSYNVALRWHNFIKAFVMDNRDVPTQIADRCSNCWFPVRWLHLRLQRCSACKIAFYCDDNCQKMHWASHRVQCKKQNET